MIGVEPEDAASMQAALAAGRWMGRGDRDGALKMWNHAIEVEDETDKKADMAMTIARVFQREKRYTDARSYARKALEYRPNWGAPYILIGDLYAASGSICDAIVTPAPGALTFPIMAALCGPGLVVSDNEVLRAMALAWQHLKIVVEPGGAVSLAAVLSGKIETAGKTTAVVISGGNVDLEQFAAIQESAD